MGKGDLRTRRGKLFRGTYGKSRPRKKKKKAAAQKLQSATAQPPATENRAQQAES
ncbi:MAG: 30S ribosomal protein THX [Pyrinomonas methylaliphatogenes]|jgi:30S ribosomal protein S31|uniref:SSU ribosomal protein S31P n=1 Tax=Pyrinomonas methylaliphatogenes TaxID=454194 RepID=A0A0B6WYJ6_9BACT|nr:30S ribosomal protein THX [Pyrinomonas methylaliphatogenes]CDM65807.1 hypothetical protein PYK22_01814 [Pyrinomonas methylaliphatogenes]